MDLQHDSKIKGVNMVSKKKALIASLSSGVIVAVFSYFVISVWATSGAITQSAIIGIMVALIAYLGMQM